MVGVDVGGNGVGVWVAVIVGGMGVGVGIGGSGVLVLSGVISGACKSVGRPFFDNNPSR